MAISPFLHQWLRIGVRLRVPLMVQNKLENTIEGNQGPYLTTDNTMDKTNKKDKNKQWSRKHYAES